MSTIEAAVFRKVIEIPGLRDAAWILDAPAGEGALTRALAERGFRVLGVDIEAHTTGAPGGVFCRADLNGELPIPGDRFDAVVSVEGIEHLEAPYKFLREAHRVLTSGGWLLLTTPNVVSLRSRIRFMASGFFHRDSTPLNEARRHPMHHIGLRTFPQLRYDLHTLGFRLHSVTCTHTKAISYVYGMFVPWMLLYTLISFRKEKDATQRKRNREIFRVLYSKPLLFGENLLLLARKVQN